MTTRIGRGAAERVMTGAPTGHEALDVVLADLTGLATAEAPASLADAVVAGAVASSVVDPFAAVQMPHIPQSRSRRLVPRIVVKVAVAGAVLLGLTGAAAANDLLPDPIQGAVADVASVVGIELPGPDDAATDGSTPAPASADEDGEDLPAVPGDDDDETDIDAEDPTPAAIDEDDEGDDGDEDDEGDDGDEADEGDDADEPGDDADEDDEGDEGDEADDADEPDDGDEPGDDADDPGENAEEPDEDADEADDADEPDENADDPDGSDEGSDESEEGDGADGADEDSAGDGGSDGEESDD